MNVKKVCTPRPVAGVNPTERSLVYIRFFLVTIKPVIFAVFITSKSKYFWVGGEEEISYYTVKKITEIGVRHWFKILCE